MLAAPAGYTQQEYWLFPWGIIGVNILSGTFGKARHQDAHHYGAYMLCEWKTNAPKSQSKEFSLKLSVLIYTLYHRVILQGLQVLNLWIVNKYVFL